MVTPVVKFPREDYTELDKFLAENPHTERTLLYFENRHSTESSKMLENKVNKKCH